MSKKMEDVGCLTHQQVLTQQMMDRREEKRESKERMEKFVRGLRDVRKVGKEEIAQ